MAMRRYHKPPGLYIYSDLYNNRQEPPMPSPIRRRAVLFSAAAAALLAACAAPAVPTPTAVPAKPADAPKPAAGPTKPTASAQAAATPAPAQAGTQSKPAATSGKRGGGGIVKLLYWQAPTIVNPHLTVGTKDTHAARICCEPLM